MPSTPKSACQNCDVRHKTGLKFSRDHVDISIRLNDTHTETDMKIFGFNVTGAGILYACGILMTIYGGLTIYSMVLTLTARTLAF